MKYLLAIAACAALATGCAHKDASTSTDQSTTANSDATASTATTAADATSTDASVAAPASQAPAAGASGGPFVAIELPVYPGSTKDPDKGMSMSSGGESVKMDFYTSKDDSATVVAWYKSHVPSEWQNFQMASGGKTVGTFASPEHGNDAQTIVITGADAGGSQIQLTTKLGSK